MQRIRVGPEIKALDQMEDCQRALEVVFQPGQEAARLPVPEEDCQRALGVVFQLGQEAAYRPDQGEVYPQVQAGDCRQVLEVDYPLVPAEAFRLAPVAECPLGRYPTTTTSPLACLCTRTGETWNAPVRRTDPPVSAKRLTCPATK